METDYLCKCNNCETVMIDENPQTNAEKHPLTGKEVEMEFNIFNKEDPLAIPKQKQDFM